MPPVGNTGIAAKYPGDLGIENDPDVIMAEGFESYNSAKESDLGKVWRVINEQHMSITTISENVVTGAKALQMSLPAQNIELYNGIDLYLTEEQKQDVIYIRYYQKIDESYAIDRTTSNHNGGSISSRYWTCGADAGPGIASNGTNKFLADFQSTQGTQFDGHSMMVYVYHPDMRYNDPTPSPFNVELNRPSTPRGQQYADHLYPDGDVMPWDYRKGNYGPNFIERPKFNIELGRWYCYEFMLKANTPGQRDGRLTAWINGEVILDFGNMRFRDINDLKIDLVGFCFGCASNPVATKAWFDNIVIAKSYIGPIYDGSQVNNDDIVDANNQLNFLSQNIPNPFTKNTEIKFYIPGNVKTAQLCIYNILGRQIMQIPINQRGEKGSCWISNLELTAGMYFYTLICDGKLMDTKQMILTK